MRRLNVLLDFGGASAPRRIGALVEDGARLRFGYDAGFVADPLPVSPIQLAVRPELYELTDRDFERLPGLLFDAMPDGWGRLLQDRAFAQQGLAREQITPMDRLAAVGARGSGALSFEPARELGEDVGEDSWPIDLNAVAADARSLFDGESDEVIPELLAGGGSPGGARPKVLAGVRTGKGKTSIIAGNAAGGGMVTRDGARVAALPAGFTPWIIKFTTRDEGADAGIVEAAYAAMARAAGITLPRTALFSAKGRQRQRQQYFGSERFDRAGDGGGERVHFQTMGGLLHADYRRPSCDYVQYVELTQALTRDMREVREAVRRMAFNVLAYNRDDHARNFGFLMDASGVWRLAPAYDLTFVAGPNGHHTTSVAGESLRPTLREMLAVADHVGLSAQSAREIIDEVASAVNRWSSIAASVGLGQRSIHRIGKVLSNTGWRG